jgi:hypothetical protein
MPQLLDLSGYLAHGGLRPIPTPVTEADSPVADGPPGTAGSPRPAARRERTTP